MSGRGTVKLKVLNVVIALLDGGVSDEDDEAEAPVCVCVCVCVCVRRSCPRSFSPTQFAVQNDFLIQSGYVLLSLSLSLSLSAAQGLRCMSMPTIFAQPSTKAAAVLREDKEKGLLGGAGDTGSPRHAKAATAGESTALSPLPLIFSYKSEKSLRGAGEAFALSVRSIMLPMLKGHAEYTCEPHEKWGDRPQDLVRGAARGAVVRLTSTFSLATHCLIHF